MLRQYLVRLGSSVLMAIGIIASTAIAARAAGSGWLLASPLFLALTVVSAEMFESQANRKSNGAWRAALLLGSGFLLASSIVALRDPRLVETLIPLFGVAAWVAIVLRSEGERKVCRYI